MSNEVINLLKRSHQTFQVMRSRLNGLEQINEDQYQRLNRAIRIEQRRIESESKILQGAIEMLERRVNKDE